MTTGNSAAAARPGILNWRLQARLARRAARRAAQMARFRRVSLAGAPILFANSFPKSGTHLLTQALSGMTKVGPAVESGLPAVVMFDGPSGILRPLERIMVDLRRFLPGDIGYGHLHAIPEIMVFMRQAQMATYFILRDPRDVVVSHVHYVTEMAPNHVHHLYYTQELHSFDERLRVSILGRPELGTAFPDIRARFAPYLPWLDQPDVLTLHFEDFIHQRRAALGQVLDFAVQRGFPLQAEHAEAVTVLEHSINPQRSPTFRQGRTGGWRAQFTDEHKQLFKAVSGDLLTRLGYETDDDW